MQDFLNSQLLEERIKEEAKAIKKAKGYDDSIMETNPCSEIYPGRKEHHDIFNSPILIFCIEQILKESNYDLKASPLMDWIEKTSVAQQERVLEAAYDRIYDETCRLNNFIVRKYKKRELTNRKERA